MKTAPVALTIAGSDCSAGAGAQADLKTFSALGVYGLTAITGVVAEVPGKVTRIDPVAPEMVRAQLTLLLEKFPVGAIKTGLLFSGPVAAVVAEILETQAKKIPLVIDPVMIATSGDRLLEPAAIEVYRERLFPLATLITPNMAEAAALTNRPVRDLSEMGAAGAELQEKFGAPVLLKGGHLAEGRAVDLLFWESKVREFSAARIESVSTHGTGCTYSAGIAAGLAKGEALAEAIARAKEFVRRAIADCFLWHEARGNVQALNHSVGSTESRAISRVR